MERGVITKFNIGDKVLVRASDGELIEVPITGIKIYINETRKRVIYESFGIEFPENKAKLAYKNAYTKEEIKQTKKILNIWRINK